MPVRVVIEFYRTRQEDLAHAVVGRETLQAHDLPDAIRMAQALCLTLDMPQFPDVMTIRNDDGEELYIVNLDELAASLDAPLT